jgi:siroheme synthase (precorrin-2 oxidase/ferrochelatase)
VSVFPIFLKLAGRRVLVVGAGPVAASKLRALVDADASVTVVAPDIHPDILSAPVQIVRAVAAAAHARGLFVNAVDDMENASAYLGATVRRAGVTLAMSTDGEAPALVGLMREALEEVLPDDLEAWMACAREARRDWLARRVPMEQRRPLLLEALVALYARREEEVRA